MTIPAELLLLLVTAAHPVDAVPGTTSEMIAADARATAADDFTESSDPSPQPTEPIGCYDCGMG